MASDRKNETGTPFTSLKDGSTDSTAIAAYYDDWAEKYDTDLKNWNYQAPQEAASALTTLLQAGDQVLDVGCGTGMFGQALTRQLDCHVDGIDISSASLLKAEAHGIYAHLQQHDLQKTPLPFGDNSFDAAACVGIMTYIEDADSLFVDLCRIVRPGGHVLFTQREDRWAEKDFDAVLQRMADGNLWTALKVSEAVPYLPGNEDFGDSIGVIHVLCRVA